MAYITQVASAELMQEVLQERQTEGAPSKRRSEIGDKLATLIDNSHHQRKLENTRYALEIMQRMASVYR